MKYAHTITITEFIKKEEDITHLKEAFKALFPFNLEQEKIQLKEVMTTGFNEQPIKILTVVLQKETHTTKFLEAFLQKLSAEQKKLLVTQKESRLDDQNHFFIRIDKERWNTEQKILLVDHGNCIHISITLAAFPAKRDVALKLVERLFTLFS